MDIQLKSRKECCNFSLMVIFIVFLINSCKDFKSFEKINISKDGIVLSVNRTVFHSNLSDPQKKEINTFLDSYFVLYTEFLNAKYHSETSVQSKNWSEIEKEFFSIDWYDQEGTASGSNYNPYIFDKIKVKEILKVEKIYIPVIVEISTIGNFHYRSKDYKDEKLTISEIFIITQDNGKWKIKEDVKVSLLTKKSLLGYLKKTNENSEIYKSLKNKWKL